MTSTSIQHRIFAKLCTFSIRIAHKRSLTTNMVSRHIAGKVALITGSTSGIGLGVAKVSCACESSNVTDGIMQTQVLAAEGCNLLLNGFGEKSDIDRIVRGIAEEHRVKVEHHPANMTSKQEIRDMFAFTRSKLGEVDILINNAGSFSGTCSRTTIIVVALQAVNTSAKWRTFLTRSGSFC